jgi:HK97 family phage prohead protease
MSKPQTFVLSDGSMTTKRIVVPTASISLAAFNANPVMLFNHVRGNVIGKWNNARIENNQLVGEPEFDDEDPQAKVISGKVARGFIRAASIGIRNVVAEERFDDAGEKYFYVISCELREASIVDIPANSNALVVFGDNDEEIDLSSVDLSDVFQTKKLVTKMDKKKIASILKLSDDVADSALEGAIEAAFSDSQELKVLKQTLADKQKAKAVELCDAAIADGRLDKDAKDGFLKLADADFESFEKTIGKLVKPVSLKDFTRQGAAGAAQKAEGRKEWTFSDWQKKDSAGLAVMQQSHPEDFTALYEAEFGA